MQDRVVWVQLLKYYSYYHSVLECRYVGIGGNNLVENVCFESGTGLCACDCCVNECCVYMYMLSVYVCIVCE